MTPRPGLLRGSKIKNYKGSNALRVTWSPPPGFSKRQILKATMIEKVKRDLILKTNPETNEQYWAPGVKTVYKPEEHDRVNAVLDILKGATTAEEVRKKV